MGISDHPTVSWETCIQDKKQQLGLDMEQWTSSKLGRNMSRLYIVMLLISLLCIVHSCKMPGWMNHRLESRNCWVKYQQPQICRWYYSNGRKWRRTKETLDEGKRREWKSWLKNKIIASDPITSWQIKGEKSGSSDRFILFSWAPKLLQMVTAAMKLYLLLWRKGTTNLDSILKSRDITLLAKVI